MKRIFYLMFLLLTCSVLKAQETRFFVPLEIQKAYDNGTRSWNGAPGDAYWHNTVDYQIEASIDPANRTLTGKENLTYYNNGPNALSTLVIRIYHDVFKKGSQRDMSINNMKDINDGVEITDLMVNGEQYTPGTPQARRSGTNMFIQLKEPLEPGASLTFSCSWKQVIPLTVRRTGAKDSTSYFVAYWYPQVAVYDDVFGWDQMNYTFQAEMYNNLGNYDVKISVPEEFTVWATGELQNPNEVLADEILQRYNEAKSSVEVVNMITPTDLNGGFQNKGTTWHYSATEVSDFAFAMSDHYCWDAAVQQVEDRQVFISSVFPVDKAGDYGELTTIQQKTMMHFSEDIPGVPYPYPSFTTFIGLYGGGMEFPMMANNAGPGRGVTIHEMFHTYFPMYVRINERRFAWMDEGWANYVTSVVSRDFFGDEDIPEWAWSKGSIQGNIGSISDLPLITSTQFMDGTNYGYASYPLPSFMYSMLNHHLGDEMFLKCLQTYIDRWKKKSPTPYDFFYTFEDVSGQDLGWLWEPWFFSYGAPDVQIVSFLEGSLTVRNAGNRPVPLSIIVTYEDDSQETILKSAKLWTENKGDYTTEIKDAGNVKSIVVNKDVPDINELDNFQPPLSEMYATLDIPSDIIGDYQIKEFPVTATISKKDGVLFMTVVGAGMQTYLLPVTTTEYESLDGSMKFEFVIEDGQCSGMNARIFGYNLTSTKK